MVQDIFVIPVVLLAFIADTLNQVGLAQTYPAVHEKRIERIVAQIFSYSHGSRTRQPVTVAPQCSVQRHSSGSDWIQPWFFFQTGYDEGILYHIGSVRRISLHFLSA